jgi:hypothetical protein
VDVTIDGGVRMALRVVPREGDKPTRFGLRLVREPVEARP